MRKLNESFWQYEMGTEMISTVVAWDVYLEEKRYDLSKSMQDRWEAFQISFRYIFGFDVHFNRTEEFVGICDATGTTYYFKDKRYRQPNPAERRCVL